MKNQHFTKIIIALVAISSVFGISGCVTNPVTGKKQFGVMGEEREKALGASYNPQVLSQFGIYKDAKLGNFLTQKGTAMARVSHRPNLPFKFQLVDSPVVNAFAVPGGYVYFTRGIMAEIGHVTARHGAQQQRDRMLGQLGLLVGAIAFPREFQQFGELAQNGLGLLFLKHGRDDESQSDKLGVAYSTTVGYDAREMGGFFKTINRLSGDGGRVPTFMSTHPDPLDRYAKVNAMAKEAQAKMPGKKFSVNRDSYLRRLEGLMYGEDPNQGYVQSNNFYHPQLKFQFPVPANWKLVNTPSQVQMAPSDGKAMIIMSLASEKNLEQAAQAAIQNNQLTLERKDNIRINGMPAIAMVSNQAQQLQVATYLIQYNNLIYKFHGMAKPADFGRYFGTFKQTFGKFDTLTDPSKLNVKPERVKIKTITGTKTLQKALNENGIPSSRHKEMAILNGMELGTQLKSGTLIKVVGK